MSVNDAELGANPVMSDAMAARAFGVTLARLKGWRDGEEFGYQLGVHGYPLRVSDAVDFGAYTGRRPDWSRLSIRQQSELGLVNDAKVDELRKEAAMAKPKMRERDVAEQVGVLRTTLASYRRRGLLNPLLNITEPAPTPKSPVYYDSDVVKQVVDGEISLFKELVDTDTEL